MSGFRVVAHISSRSGMSHWHLSMDVNVRTIYFIMKMFEKSLHICPYWYLLSYHQGSHELLYQRVQQQKWQEPFQAKRKGVAG